MAFKAKWSDEQRQAIEHAALAHGYTADEAWTAANNGTLPGIGQRLEPFQVGRSTVALYLTEARRRRLQIEEATADPAAVLGEQAAILALNYKRLVASRNKLQVPMTAQDITELAKAGREVHALIRALDPKPSRNGREKAGTGVETGNGEAEPDFVDQLASNGSP